VPDETGATIEEFKREPQAGTPLEMDPLENPVAAVGCFVSSTLVHTEIGTVDIDRVDVGMRVLSRSETTGQQTYCRVVRKFEYDNKQVFSVRYRIEDGRTDSLLVTAEHPFWIKDVGWTSVAHLQSGQVLEICDPDGRDDCDRQLGSLQDLAMSGRKWSATVVSVTTIEQPLTVYNIEVEELHTYFVGVFGVWVHNKPTTPATETLLQRSTPYAQPLATRSSKRCWRV
jgi:filamentous hemagglutinin